MGIQEDVTALKAKMDAEFPVRPGSFKGTGSPNDSSDPVVNGCPVRSFYVQTDTMPPKLWYKGQTGADTWTEAGAAESSAGSGVIFITGVAPTDDGVVSGMQYQSGTNILQSCLTNTDLLTISVEASGPKVTVNGTTGNLTRAGAGQLFSGTVDIDLGAETSVTAIVLTPDDDVGASDSCAVTVQEGPDILTVVLGPNPTGPLGQQTALKAGDEISITGTCGAEATHVRLVGGDIFDASGWVACSGGTFSLTGTVSSLTGTLTATLQARDISDIPGDEYETSATKVLSQVVPTFIDNGVTYPASQSAFKGVEPGAQNTVVTNGDSTEYTSPNADFTVSSPAVYEQDKTITCTNPGTYNDSAVNFRITARRAANDSVAVFDKIIEVADTAPIITVTQSEARLRSPGTHTVTASADQNLDSAPDIGIPVSGTWEGEDFTGGPKVWTRDITVDDADAKGTGAWTIITATNRAGISATVTGEQVVGGFTSRQIAFPALSVQNALGTHVSDTSKLVCYDTGGEAMTFYADLADHIKGFSITDPADTYNASGNLLYWCDVLQRESNLTGNDFFTIEETV